MLCRHLRLLVEIFIWMEARVMVPIMAARLSCAAEPGARPVVVVL